MKIKDIQNVIELLKLATFNEKQEEVKDFEKDLENRILSEEIMNLIYLREI